jgi:hypothetical protein
MLFLGGAAFVLMRHFTLDQISIPDISIALMPKAIAIRLATIEGAPPSLQNRLMDELGPVHAWGLLEPYHAKDRLLRDFPCLQSVRFERDWREHRVRFVVELRHPIARVTRDGQPSGWLSDAGVLFTAPPDTYPDTDLVQVDLGRGGDSDSVQLSRFLQETMKGNDWPAPLVRVAFRSPEEGWDLTLTDKTRILWGDLKWTPQKLSRLKEVLADARMRGRVGWATDLRYFEDGKILMRPKL